MFKKDEKRPIIKDHYFVPLNKGIGLEIIRFETTKPIKPAKKGFRFGSCKDFL